MKTTHSYLKPFTISITFFPVTLAIVWVLGAWMDSNQVLRYLVFLLPVIPLILAAYYFSNAINALDELQQKIQIKAMSFSLGGLVLMGVMVGLLKLAGVPNPNWAWVTVLALLLWGIGQVVFSKRLQ
jgi:hypothetical protein